MTTTITERKLLHSLARRGNTVGILTLCQSGMPIDMRDRYGFTALHVACIHHRLCASRLLIDLGASMYACAPDENEHMLDTLDLAVCERSLRLIKQLMSLGYKWSDREGSFNPIDIPAIRGDLKVLQFLLDCGAPVGSLKNRRQPIFWAIQEGQLEVVNLLLEAGADHEAFDLSEADARQSPLRNAAAEGYLEIVRTLVQHGAEIDMRDGFGSTPLMLAIRFGYCEIAKYLIEVGADVDAIDHAGDTPRKIAKKSRSLRRLGIG